MKLILASMVLFASSVFAQPVKIVVQYQAGGVTDRVARTVQTALEDNGIATVVEYRLGGGGFIAYNYLAKYQGNETVIMAASNGLTDGIGTATQIDYELNDFVVVKHLGTVPSMLVVNTSHPAKTFKQLVDIAQTRQVTYGHSGVGSGTHVAGAIVGNRRGNFVGIPYKGQSQAIVDVLGGQIDYIMEADTVLDQHIKAGKVRPLVVMSAERLPSYPDVPTLRELRVSDLGYTRWSILVANKNANPELLQKIRKIIDQPETMAKLAELGQRPAKTVPHQLEVLATQFQKIRQQVNLD
jgi:tripartite-type tricarboxylate transporter receptor subunit TctC